MRQLHLPVAAMALAAVLAAGGCSSSQPEDGSSSGGAGPTRSTDPVPSVTPSVTPVPAAGTSAPPTTKPVLPPKYPTTPRAYAEAVIAAWQQDRVDVLATLATSSVQEQIIEIPPMNMDWTYVRCDGTAGSSYCTYINAFGDLFTLRISHSLLGKARAAIEVRLDLKT